MAKTPWQMEHSVETSAPLEFAWTQMSNVANWDDPPARFVLEGSFTDGSYGTTQMPGQSPQPWKLRDVVPRQSYTVEFPLDGAVIYFKWYFAALSDERTGLTQRIILEGANAAAYLSVVQQSFALSLKAGMERIAASIGAAYKSRQ